ncbi:RecQ family ATP-dependent DNA helicase [Tundrisphaera lichenicola]|uniref:RecQ family ATP-dependent DNA helicase n=1 Tax=Tundrisphaera lichenicola TaxID=2029860 RepID=UPI003EBE3340
MSIADPAIDPDRTLRERFALEQFRAGQREVIDDVLSGRDVLCVMPTGGGKSLCYQLPALLLPGPTLVVSPLIALMKDQVDALTERGLRATLLNSSLDPAEQRARLLEIEAGKYDLVYVAPERFRSPRFIETITRVRPSLLAVDEAHCISEWGHDFRPDYARIGLARRLIGMPPCIALTATATDLVRRDIADQLGLRDPALYVTGFDRPNLSYAVVEARRDADKLVALARTLRRSPGPAIVYASSRARCESVGQFLETELRKPTVIYHAGLTREERTEAQERFMGGQVEVVVATNAFGMGVDKADIRSVIHFNLPGTLEAYYQEAGRAGRDGKDASCMLLFAPGDRYLQEMFIENEYPPPDAVFRVYEFLRGLDADPIELTHAEIKEATRLDLNESAVGTTLKILEGAGAVERFRPRDNMAIVRIIGEPDDPSLLDRVNPNAPVQLLVLRGIEGLVNRKFGESVYFNPDDFAAKLGLDRTALTRAIKLLSAELPIDYVPPFRGNAVRVNDRTRRPRDLVIDFASLEKRKQREYDKLDRMIRYAQETTCRRAYILGYFGDTKVTKCGRCDNCGPGSARPEVAGRPIDTEGAREVILKALSGVARTKGRFGKTVVAQMLTGSSSEKMARWGLTDLSTFGILGGFRQPEVVQLLDALAASGLVQSEDVDRFRPIISLTEEGRKLCKHPQGTWPDLALPEDLYAKVRFGGMERLPSKSAPRPAGESSEEIEPVESLTVEDDPSNGDYSGDPLYEKLRSMRAAWAKEAGQSAFTIFPNKTLEALVRERPGTPAGLAAVKGVGPVIRERYGAALLAAISDHQQSRRPEHSPVNLNIEPHPGLPHGDEIPSQATASELSVDHEISTEEWTWRVLDRGFGLIEAAAIRGLHPTTIVEHALVMVQRGNPVPIESFLTTETIDRWDEWSRDGATQPLEPEPVRGLWELFLACRS